MVAIHTTLPLADITFLQLKTTFLLFLQFLFLLSGLICAVYHWWQLFHMSGNLKTQPISVPDQSTRTKQRGFLFLLLGTFVIFGIAGFAPSYVFWAFLPDSSGKQILYLDPFMRFARNSNYNVLFLHAMSALGLCVSIIHQLVTAYHGGLAQHQTQTGLLYRVSPLTSLKMHRIVGYLCTFLWIFSLGCGILSLVNSGWLTIATKLGMGFVGMIAMSNVAAGIAYARCRNIASHKQHMGWAIIWTMHPGVMRAWSWLFRLFESPYSESCKAIFYHEFPFHCEPFMRIMSECGFAFRTGFFAWASCLVIAVICVIGASKHLPAGIHRANFAALFVCTIFTLPSTLGWNAGERALGSLWTDCIGLGPV